MILRDTLISLLPSISIFLLIPQASKAQPPLMKVSVVVIETFFKKIN
jgi:hypothetical protein